MAQMSFDDLKGRADSYFKTSSIIMESGDQSLIQNALEAMHLAVELAMKAAIVKNGGLYPESGGEGHDLKILIQTKFRDRKSSIVSTAKDIGATDQLSIGLSAWSMNCRYKIMTSFDDMKASVDDYKELYLWIKTNFL